MATIDVIDEKIRISNLNPDHPDQCLIFETAEGVKSFIENLSAKFDRWLRGSPGWEKRKWIGFYTTCKDENGEKAFNICKKYKELIDVELVALDETSTSKQLDSEDKLNDN